MRAGPLSRVLALVTGTVLAASCSAPQTSDQPAVDALVKSYDVRAGVWPTTGWWNSANALIALTDYMIATGDHRYAWVLDNTFTTKRLAARGDFTNDFIDDTGWWALAWLRAYDLTGDPRYLQTAQRDVDFMWSSYDDVCGGGLYWTVHREYKHAITNELFIQAAAELGTRMGDAGSVYLDRAVSMWDWFEASGMINGRNMVNDGLEPATCQQQQRPDLDLQPGRGPRRARRPGPRDRRRRVPAAGQGTGGRLHHVAGHPRRGCAHRELRAGRLRRRRPQLQGHLRPLPRRAQPRAGRPPLQRLPRPPGGDSLRPQPHRRATSTGCTGPDRSGTSAAPPSRAPSTC